MTLISNSELVLPREVARLAQAQARHAAGLADNTFSGLEDDKSPETAVKGSGLSPCIEDDKNPETPMKGTGFSPYIDSTTQSRALAPEGKNHEPGHDFKTDTPTGHGPRSGHDAPGSPATGPGRWGGLSRAEKPPKIEAGALAPEEKLPPSTNSNNNAGAPGLDSQTLESMDQELDPGTSSHDTVGAVALDGHGNLAAGTSTGGTLNKTPGRVGDSSLIGCGCYADNLSAAVSLTGWGEPIMKLVLGKWATDRVAAGTAPEIAAREAISYLYNRLGGHGGIILLGPDGRFGLAHNTPGMAWGLATPSALQTGLDV